MSQSGTYLPPGGAPGVTETLTGNTGGPVGPDGANNINIVGDGTTVTVAGNPGTSTLTISTGGHVATTYIEDSGTATPALGLLNVLGGNSVGNPVININTIGSGLTIEVCLNNSISQPDTNNTATAGMYNLGGQHFLHNYSTTGGVGGNTFLGYQAGDLALTAGFSTGIGSNCLTNLTSGGKNSVGGFQSGSSLTTGHDNSAWGYRALVSASTAVQNSAFGSQALDGITTAASGNSALGFNAGSNYTTENNNISINNTGTVADSGVTRIGTNGTATKVFISGIDGVNVGSVAKVLTEASDQLGTATITAGVGITITPTANTITISSSGTSTLTYTVVNTTPYVVLATDEFLGVDSSGGIITVQLPNAPSTGRVFTIKDITGSSNANNITITTVGGAVLIDAAATYTMNTNYASINVLFNGTKYLIF